LRSATSTRSFTTNSTPASRQAIDSSPAIANSSASSRSGARSWTAVAPPSMAAWAIDRWSRPGPNAPDVTTYTPSVRETFIRLPPPVLPGSGHSGRRQRRAGLSARYPRAPRWCCPKYRSPSRPSVALDDARPSLRDRSLALELLPVALPHRQREVRDDRDHADRDQRRRAPPRRSRSGPERQGEERGELADDRAERMHPCPAPRVRFEVGRIVALQPGARGRRPTHEVVGEA